MLAFGAVTPVLLAVGTAYEVAIAGAYLCLAAVWLGLFRAWHSERHAAAWLAVVSTAAGLAVGCRPDCAFVLPPLAVVVAWQIGRAPRGSRLRQLAAAALPVGIVGLALMAYNYARFESPFEFGFNLQNNGRVASGAPTARLDYFWENLRCYYLRPPVLSPYFPYFFPMNAKIEPPRYYGNETIEGQLIVSLLLGFTAVWLWKLRRAWAALPDPARAFPLLLAAASACVFLSMAFFGFRADRYMTDFQGPLILFLALAGGFCAAWNGAGAHGWRLGFGLLAGAAALFNVLIGFQIQDHLELFRPATYRFLSYYGNYPAELLTRAGLLRYGPIRFTFVLAPVSKSTVEPLLATGVPYYSDVLYVVQQPQGLAQFMIQHENHYEIHSGLIPVEVGHPYEVEADLGSLYPPVLDPYFRHWREPDVETLKTRALVRLNGETVIHQKLPFYDSPPNWVLLGKNPAGIDPPFPGQILEKHRRAPTGPGSRPGLTENGVWRLQFGLPLAFPEVGHPILGSGTSQHGNLLLMQATTAGKITFGFDQWNVSMAHSPETFPLAPGSHILEIFVGPQVARQPQPASWHLDSRAVLRSKNLLRVWLDGRLAWTTEVTANLDSYGDVALGTNPQGFSTADSYFLGSLDNFPYSPGEMRQFVEKNLQLLLPGEKP